jgi:hypothetical protein
VGLGDESLLRFRDELERFRAELERMREGNNTSLYETCVVASKLWVVVATKLMEPYTKHNATIQQYCSQTTAHNNTQPQTTQHKHTTNTINKHKTHTETNNQTRQHTTQHKTTHKHNQTTIQIQNQARMTWARWYCCVLPLPPPPLAWPPAPFVTELLFAESAEGLQSFIFTRILLAANQ